MSKIPNGTRVLIAAFAAIFAALGLWSARARWGADPDDRAAAAAQSQDSRGEAPHRGPAQLAIVPGDGGRTQAGGRGAPAETADAASARYNASELEALLDELRRIALDATFHAQAWPIVERIAAIASALDAAGRRQAASRLRAVAEDEAEHERVRGAGLLALARTPRGAEAELGDVRAIAAERAQDPSPEIRRAALLALSLRATAPGAPAIPLERYRNWTKLATYPVVLDRCLPPEDGALAAAVWGAAPPLEYLEDLAMTRPRVQDDQYAREIALLVDLGPRAGRPGPARERLLALAAAESSIEWLVRDSARFALALAAREDAGLAVQLLEMAQDLGAEGDGPEILHLLATESGRGAQVFDQVREVLATATADTEPLAQAEALNTLTFLIGSGDEALRARGTDALVGHLLDPHKSAFEVMLFLNRLEAADGGAAFDVGRALLATEANPEKLSLVLPSLGKAPDERKSAARDVLLGYDATEHRASVRMARLLGLARLADPRDKPFFAEQAASEPDPEVRKYAAGLLAKYFAEGG